MIRFSLKRILENAPYDLTLSDNNFVFQTDLGIHYMVSFSKEDIVLGGCATYQLIIRKIEEEKSPHDPKVEATILAIVREFFRSNLEIMLYLCDTSDGREEYRNRLFLTWFDRKDKGYSGSGLSLLAEAKKKREKVGQIKEKPEHSCIIV